MEEVRSQKSTDALLKSNALKSHLLFVPLDRGIFNELTDLTDSWWRWFRIFSCYKMQQESALLVNGQWWLGGACTPITITGFINVRIYDSSGCNTCATKAKRKSPGSETPVVLQSPKSSDAITYIFLCHVDLISLFCSFFVVFEIVVFGETHLQANWMCRSLFLVRCPQTAKKMSQRSDNDDWLQRYLYFD